MGVYSFDHIFQPRADNYKVYIKCVKRELNELFEGRNFIFLAMGPSGSGKTHSLFGKG